MTPGRVKKIVTPPEAKEGGRTYRGDTMNNNIKDFPKENRLLVDWFSFTAKEMTYHDVVHLLGMDECSWEYDYGNKGFQHKVSYGSVHVHFNDEDFQGSTRGFVWLEMSGQGCRTFETYGNGDFEMLFKLVLDEFGKPPHEKKIRPKRIDIAFDDMTGILDINEIYRHTYELNYVSRLRESECHVKNGNNTRGLSVDFGSKSSNVFVRIYDKAAERGFSPEEVPHWVRCELQLKDENAGGFLALSSEKGMNTVYKGVLKNYLSFREYDETDTNKRRWEECTWWTEFLENAVPLSVWQKPGVTYNEFNRTEYYILSQPIGGIQTLIKCYGAEKFINRVMNQPAPKNPKYQRMVMEYHKDRVEYINEEYEKVTAALSDQRQEVQKTHAKADVQKLELLYDRYQRIKNQRDLLRQKSSDRRT